MPIDEPIDEPGFFWLPEKDAERFPGTLTINETGRISFRLFAETENTRFDRTQASLNPHLSRAAGSPVHDRVHGRIRGRAVTLDHCIPTTMPWFSPGVAEGSYVARRAYVGAWYGVDETPTFSRINFRIDSLHEWLMLSGLDTNSNVSTLQSEGFTVSFNPPEPIAVQLSSGITFSFNLSYSLPSVGFAPAEVTITQAAYLSLRADPIVPHDDLLSIATTFKRLLSFAADEACDITSIVGFSPELVDDGREVPIRIYTGQSDRPQPTRETSRTRMLFTYRDVESRFPDAIDGWLSTINELEPAINLYDALMVNAYRYADGRFLATAQASEALHRRLFSTRTQMSRRDFDVLVGALSIAAPPDRRVWVQTRLKHANEPTFGQRIDELLKPFATLFGTKKDRRRFRRDVVDIRNRLTHLPANGDEQFVDTKSLITTQIKLEVLFQLNMLHQFGFDDDEIDTIAQKWLVPKMEIEFL